MKKCVWVSYAWMFDKIASGFFPFLFYLLITPPPPKNWRRLKKNKYPHPQISFLFLKETDDIFFFFFFTLEIILVSFHPFRHDKLATQVCICMPPSILSWLQKHTWKGFHHFPKYFIFFIHLPKHEIPVFSFFHLY